MEGAELVWVKVPITIVRLYREGVCQTHRDEPPLNAKFHLFRKFSSSIRLPVTR